MDCYCLKCKKRYPAYGIDYKSPGVKEAVIEHPSDQTTTVAAQPVDGEYIHFFMWVNDNAGIMGVHDGFGFGLCNRCLGKEIVRCGQIVQLGGSVVRR